MSVTVADLESHMSVTVADLESHMSVTGQPFM